MRYATYTAGISFTCPADKTITRLGDTHERKFDVWIITVTNVNLMEAVHNQTLHENVQ
ncbi:sigma 54-interacting transcriptional regulator [uncultured Eubacterium sp.]|uniref:sigma 54-interacting transcriptional regulator n=1 Tax=uncultured Eubacterium sp. TaxID=165185 RepID=UPI00343E8913